MAIYTATTGVDNLSGTTDWDTFVIGADVMLQAGDVFNGGAESFNDIRLDAFGAGAHSWQFNLATFSNFEAVIFNPDSAGTLTVYANANQFGPGPNAAALQVTGSALTSDNIDITFTAPATYNFNTWTFDNWLAGPDGIFLRGSDAGADTIGGTSQTDDIFGGAGDDILSGNNGGDYIVGGAGNDTIDGGDGSDVVQYSSAASNFYVYLAAGGNLVVIDTTGAEGTDSVINTQYLRFITDAYSTAIYTTNNAATASIAGPYLIQQGQGVAISATASDADVAENDAITYAWDLDNDGQFDDSTTLSPTLTAGQLTTLGINTAGAHTLSLRVTDRAGVATTVSTTLTIEAVASPVISSNGGGATAAINVAENTTAVTTVVAADANTGDTVTYSISGGADAALFSINSSTGVLAFAAARNYEAPGDVGGNNVYDVIVRATDGTNADTQAIAVTVTDVADVVNGTAGVDTITAGPAGGTYNLLGGNDNFTGSGAADLVTGGAGNDTINGAGGTDTAAFSGARSNYYIYTSGGNVIVRDLTGVDGVDTLSNVENLQFTSGTIASTGFSSNVAPTASAGGPYLAQIGQTVAITATASDADASDGDTISYAWDLDNDGQFDDSTALSPTLTSANLTSLGINTAGAHTLSLRVTDSTGTATTVTSTLTLETVASPVISSDGGGTSAAINVAENTTAVTTVVAADANTGDTVAYSISGGADASLFAINASTGALSFLAARNYEAPVDAGANNVYDVVVTASDGANTDTQAIAVTVTDVADVVNGTAGVDAITAGPAGGTYNLLAGNDSFAGSGAADLVTGGEGNDTVDGAGGTDTAVFAGARANYYIFTSGGNVVVHDLVGTDGTDTLSNVENLQFTDGTIASTGFTSNEAPVSNAGGPYYAQVGQAVTLVGTASDPDTAEGDVITYAWDFNDDGIVGDSTVLSPTLSGVDIAGFGLGVGDHTITLRVTDAAGIARDSAVTLTIAASAAPVISSDGGGATASVNVAENTTAVTTVVATDANLNDTVTYALSGADAALFTLDASTGVLTFNAAPDHETPADAGGDNIYNVTVTASDNGALTDTQDIAITVTDAADAVNGTAGDDVITAHPAGGAYNLLGGADTFTGGASADLVTGGEGNDAIDGGGGADTAVFSGARANYYIYTSGANVVVHDLVGTDGTDTLTDVESLQFSDATIASSGFAANAAPVVSAGGPYYAQVGQAVVIAATANDANTADGDVISYAWDLDNDGQFDDAATLSPTLSGADITTLGLGVGDHTITLRVTDAAGVATTSAVTLTIAASAAPVISSNGGGATASLNVAENTAAVTTAIASDTNLNDAVTYSITGDDAALFSIDANTGVLTFNTAPDYDAPTDVGADNIYNVTIVASDNGALTDTQDLTITVTDLADVVDGTAGVDTIAGGPAGGTYNLLGGNDSFTGSAAVDLVSGGEGEDVIDGAGDSDTLFGDADADTITGGGGNDIIDGGAGADSMTGGTGSDTYYVDDAGDTIAEISSQGYDRVHASVSYALAANVESLTLTGAAALNGDGNNLNNAMAGNEAANILHGANGNDTIDGAGGGDTLFGDGGADAITGGGGNDVINGGTGADTMTGGTGSDTYYVDNAGDVIVELSSQGYDGVSASVSYTLATNVESLTLIGAAALNGDGNNLNNAMAGNEAANILHGANGNDTIDGAGGSDTLFGDGGADAITGGGGNDVINGGTGADTMTGGTGSDTYYVDNTGDVIVELSSQGYDSVASSVSYALAVNVEGLILTGASAINGGGNGHNNTLTGNAGANTLHGGNGNDTLNGAGGHDTLFGDSGSDTFVFTNFGASNWDTLSDYNVAADTIHLNDAAFTALETGALDAGQFHIGTSAADADDHIIYNSATGALYYDADGAGGVAQSQFAQVTPGLGLTAGEFLII